MDVSCKLTVYFEEPFWIGVYEISDGKKLRVAKMIFGSEPKDYDVLKAILDNRKNLRFSPSIDSETKDRTKINPKRMQRQIIKQLSKKGTSTKAQAALKLQHEQNKKQRKTYRRKITEETKQRKYELSRQKKKEKHRGR